MRTTEQDFTYLIEKHKSVIYTACLMFSKDRTEIDDMFQEILIKLWNGYEKFRGESDVKTWIYRVSLNCCLNQQKKKKREPDHIALTMDIDPFEGISDRSLQTKRLYDRINRLGLIDRAIILLWLEGMTYSFELSDDRKQLKEDYSALKKELEAERIINDDLMKSAFKRNLRTINFDKKLSLVAGVVAAAVMPIVAILFSVPFRFLVTLEIFILSLIVVIVLFYRKYDLNKVPFYDVLNASKTIKEFKKSYIHMTIIVWIALIAIIVSFMPRIFEVWSTPLKTVCAVTFLAIVITVCLFVEFRYSKTIIDSCNSITKSLEGFNE